MTRFLGLSNTPSGFTSESPRPFVFLCAKRIRRQTSGTSQRERYAFRYSCSQDLMGTGWRGNFLLSAAEQWLKHELTKNFKVIRDLELLPQLLGQDWSSVFLQRFDGAVT